MIRGYSRTLNVIATVDALRDLHREFRRPVTGPAIRAVLAREDIAVLYRPVARSFVLGIGDDFVITLSNRTPAQERWKRALHEYGHIKLHLTERDEIVRNLVPCTRHDPREIEANLFSLFLVIGPAATSEHPTIARLVAALEAPRYTSERRPGGTATRKSRAKSPAAVEKRRDSTPCKETTSPPFDDGRAYERRLAKQGAQRVTAAPATWINQWWRTTQ